MLHTVSLTKKGQMTIPKAIRQVLNLKPSSKVVIELIDQQQNLVQLKPQPGLMQFQGFLPPTTKQGKRLDPLSVRDELEKTYQRA